MPSFDVDIRLSLCHEELRIVNVTVLVEVVIIQNWINLSHKLFIGVNFAPVSISSSVIVI